MRLSMLCLAAFLLAGCATVESVRDKIEAGPPPRVRVFPADPRTTYKAARAALDQMGYTFEHGGPAEGELTALGPVMPADIEGSSHQYSLAAHFRAVEGGTEVSVQMKEIYEEDTEHHQGMATTSPLRDTPLYEVFFRGIRQALPPG